jgi:radical SAM protein with 4Fe4S-binding SPASM domain
VNARSDTREYALMEESLFERVVSQLRELDYSGFLSLFSNNEPLLDDRIAAFCKYAREMLPKAYLHLWTNGTLLSVQKYAEIIECLDELVIDNYSDDMRLIKPVERIANHIGGNKDLIQKTAIVLRKQNQVLTTRGGSAPNRRNEPKPQVGGQTCVYPFKQLVVRPTGEVSLCCNDALGAHTLGDLSRQSVGEVWYGEKYKEIRRLIARGRRNLDPCSGCDVFFLP